MGAQGIDPLLLKAWLSARSIARGLPAPVAEYGGFRVDTNAESEVVRWVFPGTGSGLAALARSIDKPRYLIKLCGTGDALRAVLPGGWEIHAPSHFMRATSEPTPRRLVEGYRVMVTRAGMVSEARIVTADGALAASGYAADTADAFVYDRIVTEAAHRRKGLGHALMMALRDTRRRPDTPELLVATDDGRALYATLGWETISPYATASIVAS